MKGLLSEYLVLFSDLPTEAGRALIAFAFEETFEMRGTLKIQTAPYFDGSHADVDEPD